jgi:putative FmdB family regulatory protein
MPLYEYHCSTCEQDFDQLVRFSEADKLPVCPRCGAEETHKKISAGAMIGSTSSGTSNPVSRPTSSPFT